MQSGAPLVDNSPTKNKAKLTKRGQVGNNSTQKQRKLIRTLGCFNHAEVKHQTKRSPTAEQTHSAPSRTGQSFITDWAGYSTKNAAEQLQLHPYTGVAIT